MRALPVSLLLLSLTGCSGLYHAPSTVQSGPKNSFKDTTSTVHKAAPRSAPLPAKLYKNPEELVGKPFRDLGEVYGSTCKVSLQDPPPNISAARRNMQIRAAAMKGNGVLLHQCQIVSAVAGCYQQAICQGTALSVSQ